MKKYCIFSAQYLPHMGGVERYTHNLAKKLIEDGNEVVVVTSNIYKLQEYERMDGIPVYRLPCWSLLEGRYPVLKMNSRFFKINKVLKNRNFDMIIVNTRFYPHSLYGMILARKMKSKCITLDHGTSHLSVHNKFLDFVGAIFEHTLTKVDQIFCKDYYGVSKACNEWLAHFHIKAKGVLYNSIDLEEVKTVQKNISELYRKKYDIPDKAIVITFTGRLLKEKGLPSLLNVVERINKERKDVYLFIAGDGDMGDEVKSRSNEQIIPVGRIDFEQIVALLTDSDIFCLPSFSEGFSTSILEAAACGCYILTTARGGARELLINDEYGCVIQNNDEELLYNALIETINNPEKRKRGIDLTYKRIEKCFTWEILSKQVERICED
ncbi:glycosyltransferase family 4 protein [Dorea sp. Marseille-P4042]|uniref:glycosyltransferase family 4 protein n=1 Tax=Dorea sp. Marseille-P4042 TaxID=2080749 RepID=UPI000CF9160F|nr:glycosyltransferase family 4 protein [Dorea sp. Marseille-P4042]